MKICPECHKLSRDDDFCSYCGAAVFSADDVSDSRAIDCNTYDRGHDHSKITYDVSERGTNVRPPVPEVHAPELPSGNNTSYSSYTGPVRRLPPEPQQYHSEPISSAQEAEDFVNDLLNGRRNSRRAPMSARDKKVLAVVVIFTLIILGKVIFGILAGFISMLEAF